MQQQPPPASSTPDLRLVLSPGITVVDKGNDQKRDIVTRCLGKSSVFSVMAAMSQKQHTRKRETDPKQYGNAAGKASNKKAVKKDKKAKIDPAATPSSLVKIGVMQPMGVFEDVAEENLVIYGGPHGNVYVNGWMFNPGDFCWYEDVNGISHFVFVPVQVWRRGTNDWAIRCVFKTPGVYGVYYGFRDDHRTRMITTLWPLVQEHLSNPWFMQVFWPRFSALESRPDLLFE